MSMAQLMIVKFEKCWDEYSVVLVFGAILDQMTKLETLSFFMKKLVHLLQS